MRWPLNYLASIALHVLVLFALVLPVARSVPKDEPRYLEVTLVAAEPPAVEPPSELPPIPNVEPSPAETPSPESSPLPGDPISASGPSQDSVTPAPLPRDSKAPSAPARLGPVTRWGTGYRGLGRGGSVGNGHYYEAVYTPDGITWYEADKFAAERGGYLATLASRSENLFVFGLINHPIFWRTSGSGAHHGPWLGGYREPNESRPRSGWHWVKQGELFNFQNWHPGEPDNLRGNENCLHYIVGRSEGLAPLWNDLGGASRLFGFVIEYDNQPQPLTSIER